MLPWSSRSCLTLYKLMPFSLIRKNVVVIRFYCIDALECIPSLCVCPRTHLHINHSAFKQWGSMSEHAPVMITWWAIPQVVVIVIFIFVVIVIMIEWVVPVAESSVPSSLVKRINESRNQSIKCSRR